MAWPLADLFDTSDFPARWHCGNWSHLHGWTHVVADVAIFGAYAAIPFTLVYFLRKRTDLPFPPVFWLFAAFIAACGLGHLLDATIFWHPWYRLAGAVKVLTAIASWMTVVALIKVTPLAITLPGLAKVNERLAKEVSDRKEAEIALRSSEERFRALIDTSAQIVWQTDKNGEAVEDSPSWRAFTGQTYERWLGWGRLDAIHPDDRMRIEFIWRRAIDKKIPVESEYRIQHRSGEWRWTAVRAVPLFNEDNGVREWVGMNTDITQRKHSEEQFRLAIEAAPTGMVMMDRAGKIVMVNAQIEMVFGYARENLLGRQIEALVPEGLHGPDPASRSAFFADPKARSMGKELGLFGRRVDGVDVPVEVGLTPLQTSEGDFVLGSIVDVTERRRAEEERQILLGQLWALNAQLEERVRERTSELSAALKERDVLLQEIHHRVKNNLQVISSLINMQVRQLEEGKSKDALEVCQTRILAIALIHEKLYQSKDYASVPFSEYARGLVASVFNAAGVSPSLISLELKMDNLTLAVNQAIPCGLILNELITNVLKHAFPRSSKGTIVVELREIAHREVMLSVSDNGIGMSPTFDPKTSASLGVQLVSTLVEQLEGDLEIVCDQGTTIRIKFPLDADA
jgi:PAS domain S-box-containing protein